LRTIKRKRRNRRRRKYRKRRKMRPRDWKSRPNNSNWKKRNIINNRKYSR